MPLAHIDEGLTYGRESRLDKWRVWWIVRGRRDGTGPSLDPVGDWKRSQSLTERDREREIERKDSQNPDTPCKVSIIITN